MRRQGRSKFVDCAASNHSAGGSAGAGPDLDLARVMSVFDTAIGITAAQPLLGRPRIKGVASIPCHYGSKNGMHRGLLSAVAGSTPKIGVLGRGGAEYRVVWAVDAGGHRGPRQRRHALGDQNGEIEHTQPDRDSEKPGVQLTGDPVEPDQIAFHRRPRMHTSAAENIRQIMLRCNIKTSKRLLKYG